MNVRAQEFQKIVGLGIRIQGHLKIVEYEDRAAYDAGQISRVLVNRRNAVHKENAVNLVVNALTNRSISSLAYMAFGNGGTTLDNTGTITFKAPHVTGPNADLYSPVYFQMVDDTLGALPGNQMAIRHIHNTVFTDMDIRCLINAGEPFGQLPNDLVQPFTLKTTNEVGSLPPSSPFIFDEIGLKLSNGTLITHVVFVPILKSATSVIEVVYTLRLAVAQPSPGEPDNIFFMTGVQATSAVGTMRAEQPFRIGAVRLNDSPYFVNMPAILANSPVGSLSMWVKTNDMFTMAFDLGPALISSAERTSMDISGRGYTRRQPTAITRTNPVQITIPNHGLANGDSVTFENIIGGCSELLGTTNVVTVVNTNNFTIPVNGTGFAAAYTGPAQVTLIVPTRPLANTLRITFSDSDDPTDDAANIFYWNAADTEQIPANQWVNLLISWDMNHPSGEKILQVFFGDTALASTSDPTYRYDPDAGFSVDYTSTPAWMIGQPITVQNFVSVPQVAREVLRSRS